MDAIDFELMETDYHWIIGNPDVYYNETHTESLQDVDAYITNFRMTVDPSTVYSTFNLPSHDEWTLKQKLVFDTVFVLREAVISYSDEMKRKFPGRSLYSLIPGDTIMLDCEDDWTGMPKSPLTRHLTQNLNLHGLTGHITFNEIGNRVDYSISIYSGKGGSMDIKRGEWIQNRSHWEQLYNDELATDVVHLSIDPTWTAGNEIFVVGSVMVSPFMMDVELDYSSTLLEDNERFEGYIPDLMMEIRKVLLNDGLEFEYELVPYDDGQYGYKDLDSEEWSGVIGAVINQEIDIATGPLTITDKREEEVDFTLPISESPVQILVKHPSYIYNTHDFSFTFPLGVEVWCANLVALFFVAGLLWIINRSSTTEWAAVARRGEVHPVNKDNFNFKNALWFVTSSAFLQSYDASPRSNAGRIGAAVWWVFSLLMLSSYCLNLSNYMNVNKQQAFYRTSRDLLQQTEIVYGCVKDGSTYSLLEDAKHGDLRSIYEYMFTNVYDPYVSDIGTGIERVRESNGKYAFLAESALMLNEITESPCNVYLVPEAIGTVRYGLAVQPGSPLRDQLSYAIKVLKENGVLEELDAKWMRPQSECDNYLSTWNKQGLYSLTIVDLKGIYYILLIGVAISLLFFFLELMCYLLLRPRRRYSPMRETMRETHYSFGVQLQRSKENVSNEDERDLKETAELDPTTTSSTKQKQWL
ncbi:probable glutamate receptor [Anneissia japonica]|uniref:probable glutamate receptor n=1 Tax=Anneissia japonica TaxID=1529436 RepID=UPI0014257939|nr:probable glutamate receptor [Anneissia japonica]